LTSSLVYVMIIMYRVNLMEVVNEVRYHVALDLAPELIKEIKHAAVEQGISIKELIKRAIEGYAKPRIVKEE